MSDDDAFLLECSIGRNYPNYDILLDSNCCAWAVISKLKTMDLIIRRNKSNRKFELNFIKQYFAFFLLYTFTQPNWTLGRFWCAAKYYACENYKYNLKDLYKTVLKTLDLITIFTIFYYYQHYIRTIDAYCSKLEYKTKLFIKTIYYYHKQVVNKSKW